MCHNCDFKRTCVRCKIPKPAEGGSTCVECYHKWWDSQAKQIYDKRYGSSNPLLEEYRTDDLLNKIWDMWCKGEME
jgi:hypothetical protein